MSARTGAAPSCPPPECVALSGFSKEQKKHSLIMGLASTVLQLGLPLGPLRLEPRAPLVVGHTAHRGRGGSAVQEAVRGREVGEQGCGWKTGSEVTGAPENEACSEVFTFTWILFKGREGDLEMERSAMGSAEG